MGEATAAHDDGTYGAFAFVFTLDHLLNRTISMREFLPEPAHQH